MVDIVDLKSARDNALKYLIAVSQETGVWKDFSIPKIGESDEWVSAFTALCLLDSGIPLDETVKNLLMKTAGYLKSVQNADGGWRYNSNCESDCDSTAFAILFLKRFGYPVGKEAYSFLLSCQKPDGGFTTYPYGILGWGISHTDVTANALNALYGVYFQDYKILLNAKNFLKRRLTSCSLPPAYWWKSEFYTTAFMLNCFRTYGYSFQAISVLDACLEQKLPDSPFDIALLLQIVLQIDRDHQIIDVLCQSLLGVQKKDGSFYGGSILRVTNCKILDIESTDAAGFVADDVNSVFTTALALKVIGWMTN